MVIADPPFIIHHGDSRQVLKGIDDESVHCCITSPPYWGQRSYGGFGEIGQEGSLESYVDSMAHVFIEVRRVLRPDGILWVILGDRYLGKQLQGLPWRIALKLQEIGLVLRADIIWDKCSPIPLPVLDRPTPVHEYCFLFSKKHRYHYDGFNLREPGVLGGHRNRRSIWRVNPSRRGRQRGQGGEHPATFPPDLILPMVWAGTSDHGVCGRCGAQYRRITQRGQGDRPDPGHSEINRYGRGIHGIHRKTGQKYNDWLIQNPLVSMGFEQSCQCEPGTPVPAVVLDPFCGIGTTGAVSLKQGRRFIGIDANEQYCDSSRRILGGIVAAAKEANVQMPLIPCK